MNVQFQNSKHTDSKTDSKIYAIKDVKTAAENRLKPGGTRSAMEIISNMIFSAAALLCAAPLLLVLAVSLTEEKELLKNGYSFIPHSFSTRAYEYIISSGDTIWRAYGVTVFVTLTGTLLSLLIICMYAYPLSRPCFKLRNQFAFIVYFTVIFGGGLVPWYIVYTQLIPINDTILILIVPYLMNAWYVLIMRTFIKTTVPESVIDSATIDGAGELRIFFRIVMPLCKAGLATIGLFVCLAYWNDFWLPLVFLKKAELYNIQYLMYQTLISIQFLANNSSMFSESALALGQLPSESARMAIAVLSVGPIVLAFPFFQRYFVKGLTIGAVKG